MDHKPGTFIILSLLVMVMAATVCELTFIENKNDLEAAIIAQNTIVVELNTQVADQPKIDGSIWDAISWSLHTNAIEIKHPHPRRDHDHSQPLDGYRVPTGSSTYIEKTDNVSDAFLVHDIEHGIELVRVLQYPCTTVDGLGEPLTNESSSVLPLSLLLICTSTYLSLV